MAYDEKFMREMQLFMDKTVGKIAKDTGRPISVYRIAKAYGMHRQTLQKWHNSYQKTNRK